MSTNKFHSSVGEVKPDNRNFLDKISDNLNNYLVDRNKANVNREEFSNNGSSTVDNSNNADVNVLEGGRGGTNTSTDQYGRDFDDPEFGQPLVTDSKQSTKQKEEQTEENKFSIKKDTFGKYSTRRRGGVLRYPMELMTQETDYLQIDIQKYVPLGNYLSRPGANTRYVTGNNFFKSCWKKNSN